MLERAPAKGVIYDFVAEYQKRRGKLPPSATRLRTYEHDFLPTTEFLEHLEADEPAVWAEIWGKKRFVDSAPRPVGDYERSVSACLTDLRRNNRLEVVHYMVAGDSHQQDHALIVGSHKTEWGRPAARIFWSETGSISQVLLEFIK